MTGDEKFDYAVAIRALGVYRMFMSAIITIVAATAVGIYHKVETQGEVVGAQSTAIARLEEKVSGVQKSLNAADSIAQQVNQLSIITEINSSNITNLRERLENQERLQRRSAQGSGK
mgnify:CR=1 FL=1